MGVRGVALCIVGLARIVNFSVFVGYLQRSPSGRVGARVARRFAVGLFSRKFLEVR